MNTKLMNMCIIENEKGEFLVQDRIKNWKGIAFPGGKMIECEGVIESTVREIKEETGLDIFNLKFFGFKTWIDFEDKITNIVMCFKTNSYKGKLIENCDEGRNFWVKKEDIKNYNLANNLEATLDLYYNNNVEILWKKEKNEWKEIIF